MNRIIFLIGVILSFGLFSCQNKVVTLESLLNEMTNRNAITHFPDMEYSLKQFSSYDRRTVTPDNNDWWANADYTQFLREEKKDGRREFVMFDAAGPGAVVRFWMTFAGEGASQGTLRIYIDNEDNPVIEGNVLEILSGEALASEPFATSVSPETEYQRRGHNLYLPVPYYDHCKITYECDAVKFENNRWRPSIYYNICYRTYKKNVAVESISKQVLSKAKPLIEKTAGLLLNPEITGMEAIEEKQKIAAGEHLTLNVSGKGKAISKIRIKVVAENQNQALRSTVLSVTFDGNETVWVPVGEFFGTGYQIFPSQTWYTKVSEDGTMESYWLMPFKDVAQVKVINYGEQPVDLSIELQISSYKWNNSSMYFGAAWHEFNRVNTAKDVNLENHEWHYDINYIDIKGKGVYVGDALTVFNTVDAWWGEGDEKIFVDGEDFPSCIGTGTEDYYGYAWCRPEKFIHPFIAQPTGAGNFHPGMTVNMRYRSLDAMPFVNDINSNIEMWHWVKTKINFAMSSFWYVKPGFTANVKPNPEIVKIPVSLKRSDIYPPVVDENGLIEGEYLEIINVQSGTVSTQSGNFGWSNENQLWWINGNKGDELTAKFILDKTGKYKISAKLTKAVDYGIILIYFNGVPAGKSINCFEENKVIPFDVDLGTQTLSAGENIISIKILGADRNAKPGNMAGIDAIHFQLLR